MNIEISSRKHMHLPTHVVLGVVKSAPDMSFRVAKVSYRVAPERRTRPERGVLDQVARYRPYDRLAGTGKSENTIFILDWTRSKIRSNMSFPDMVGSHWQRQSHHEE